MRKRRSCSNFELQKQFEDKTNASRILCEGANSEFSLTKEHNEKLLNENVSLREKNNGLLTNNNFLAREILAQSETISRNKQSVADYKNAEAKLISSKKKIESDISDINILLLEINKKYDEEIKKFSMVKGNVKEAQNFFDKLQEKINQTLLKISEQEKLLAKENEKLSERKKESQDKEESLNQKVLSNQQEDTRLRIYRERLNNHYKTLGLNIKL